MLVDAVFGATDKSLLYGRIYTLLRTYRCHNTLDCDGNPLDLVDALTPEGARSIAPGEEEIELLADALWAEVVQEIEAAEVATSRGSGGASA